MSHFSRTFFRVLLAMVFTVLIGAAAHAQDEYENVQINPKKLTDGIYVIMEPGGNIAFITGGDATFMIDDKFAPLTEKITAAIAGITPHPVKFVLNTHWHGDHTGGNENLGKAGAVLVGHENVRKRLSMDQFQEFFERATPASPPDALQTITFTTDITFHLNGETINVFHAPNAHTDGDSIVHFTQRNVIHMGDTFFNGIYPFIDVSSGGSINGIIAAADRVLPLINDATIVIPGHGPVTDKQTLIQYRDTLVTIRDRIAAMVTAGKTLGEVRLAAPTKEFDARLGGGFIKSEQFVDIVYISLKNGIMKIEQ